MRRALGCAKTGLMKRHLIRPLITAALLFMALPAGSVAKADERNFIVWLDQFKREVNAQGLTGPAVQKALENARFIPRVIELDRKQPEGTITFEQYLEKQLVPLPELVTDDVPADDPDVTEQIVDAMNK